MKTKNESEELTQAEAKAVELLASLVEQLAEVGRLAGGSMRDRRVSVQFDRIARAELQRIRDWDLYNKQTERDRLNSRRAELTAKIKEQEKRLADLQEKSRDPGRNINSTTFDKMIADCKAVIDDLKKQRAAL